MWVFRAVVRVNTAPQCGHSDLAAAPERSRWCRSKLLKVENSRPLQPWSQHCGFGRDSITRTWLSGSGVPAVEPGVTNGEGATGIRESGLVVMG